MLHSSANEKKMKEGTHLNTEGMKYEMVCDYVMRTEVWHGMVLVRRVTGEQAGCDKCKEVNELGLYYYY